MPPCPTDVDCTRPRCPVDGNCVVLPCPPDAICERPVQNPCPPQFAGAQRVSSHIRASLDGRIVRYEIEDRYVNRGGRPAEVDYVLPLPKGAAFENLELSINGEMVAGETMKADRARGIYEEIVRKLRDPALVEWMGHDMLRTRIFPIQPGEEKRVVVRFSAVAEREGDALRLDWPARTMPGARTDDDWFELRYPRAAAGTTLGDAYSPTHNLSGAGRRGEERVLRAADATRTMTILVPVRRDASAALSFLGYAPAGEDGYALVTLSPPMRDSRGAGRDLTFIVDVSGSMSGQKIAQARAAGRQFLGSLDPTDRFRIIAFSNDVREFRDGWTTATGGPLREAAAFIEALRPGGGTNIAGALDAALAARSPSGRIPLVLMITDGAPTVGETKPEAIAREAADHRGRARVFTFGLGADVNANLLEQLALEGRGTATFLRPDESVERAVGVVSQRLTRPVATDVTLRLDGARLYAVQPQGAIDIFGGQDLVVLARYAGGRGDATLTVEGQGPDGPVRWTQRVTLPARGTTNAFVARLWAVQRVGWLSAERRRNGPNAELDNELRELGERHGIPTELTSYLVVEPGMQTAQFRTLAPVNGPATSGRVDATAQAGGAGSSVASAPGVANEVRRFEAAKLSADQREVKTLGDERQNAVKERDADLQVVGSRSFKKDKDGVWSDTKAKTATRTVAVKAYSEAYFTLLRELPELQAWLAVGDNVRIEGRAVTIEVTTLDAGLSTLDAQQLAALVRDWR
ncbi:MAG: VIT domain-containing protein [Gemmatimonadota bacterium]|nr:VIT domain-containing protein [Gemmatimonadota bacterium]